MDPSYVWQRAQLRKEYQIGTHPCDSLARCISWSKGSEIARPAFPLLDRSQSSCPSAVSMAWIVRCTQSRTSPLTSPPTLGSTTAGHGFGHVDHHCVRQWGVLSIPWAPILRSSFERPFLRVSTDRSRRTRRPYHGSKRLLNGHGIGVGARSASRPSIGGCRTDRDRRFEGRFRPSSPRPVLEAIRFRYARTSVFGSTKSVGCGRVS